MALKGRIASALRARLRPALCRAALACLPRAGGAPRVLHFGGRGFVGGPMVKLHRLAAAYPDSPFGFNLIYSVSGLVPPALCASAQARGVPVVAHVNSVFTPLYRPDTWRALNEPIARLHALADHVVYGSRHAAARAPEFIGKSAAPFSVIHNAVDTGHYRPPQHEPEGPLTILTTGRHTFRHRLEPLIRALPLVQAEHPGARLIIAGPLVPGEGEWDCGPETVASVIADSGAEGVELIPVYSQDEAPALYGRCHVFAHLTYMDWTPNVLVEAMACGRAVVHTGTGGMGEQTGEAAVSLNLPPSFERVHRPDPEAVAAAICEASARREELGRAARARAVERFGLDAWLAWHREIFEALLAGRTPADAEGGRD